MLRKEVLVMTITGLAFITIAIYCGLRGVYLLFVKPFKKGSEK